MDSLLKDLHVKIHNSKKQYLNADLNKLEFEYNIGKITEKELFSGLIELYKVLDHQVYYKTKSKPDYFLKSKCLESGQYYIVKEMNRILYDYELGLTDSLEYSSRYQELNNLIDDKLFNECQKMLKADYQKRKRLKNRITELLLSGKCYFITLTFDDKTLNNTQPHIRRKYVQQFLKNNSLNYVGNIDYGKLNGREHYHAIIRTDYEPTKFSWIYGFIDCQLINYYNSDNRLASYILKLTHHALKETTKRYALLYPSRKKSIE